MVVGKGGVRAATIKFVRERARKCVCVVYLHNTQKEIRCCRKEGITQLPLCTSKLMLHARYGKKGKITWLRCWQAWKDSRSVHEDQ